MSLFSDISKKLNNLSKTTYFVKKLSSINAVNKGTINPTPIN